MSPEVIAYVAAGVLAAFALRAWQAGRLRPFAPPPLPFPAAPQPAPPEGPRAAAPPHGYAFIREVKAEEEYERDLELLANIKRHAKAQARPIPSAVASDPVPHPAAAAYVKQALDQAAGATTRPNP